MQLPVLFRREPVVPVAHTSIGIVAFKRRPVPPVRTVYQELVRIALLDGPFLAAFDAGLHDLEVL